MNKRCVTCSEFRRCRESRAAWVFFAIGMIATIAVRLVTVLSHIKPVYGQVAWYVGIGGFFVFFLHKFRVDRQRYHLIVKSRLMEKVSRDAPLASEDRDVIRDILCALSYNKDRINYFIIFSSSALAILTAVYFDFIWKKNI